MRLQFKDREPSRLHDIAERKRLAEKAVADFWFKRNMRILVFRTVEEFEACGVRWDIYQVLRHIGIINRNQLQECIEIVSSYNLWLDHGFHSRAFENFKGAHEFLQRNKSVVRPDTLARAAKVNPRAVWRYFIRNPQKAWMLGIKF